MPADARDEAKARRSIVVIERFYRNPDAVREHALRQRFYLPYESERAVRAGRQRATWWASRFRDADDCPFKSSPTLVASLEQAVGESIDTAHWRGTFPLESDFKPPRYLVDEPPTCLWNCCFHVKPDNGQQLGGGVHNHVTDSWNAVGPEGWAGIIYLSRGAPLEGGLHLWRNKDLARQFDWMTPAENWELVDSLGNVFNRLLLVRGDIPHSGARGWGDRLDNGRMYQTFFFKTKPRKRAWPIDLPEIGA
jgi:hypothetical protein